MKTHKRTGNGGNQHVYFDERQTAFLAEAWPSRRRTVKPISAL
jgi:hypothetical protein